ncbi:MAG: hypothetical protein R2712_09495 [Vicinamibacterales bacterium]
MSERVRATAPRLVVVALLTAAIGSGFAAARRAAPDLVTLSIVATTDLHGAVFARDGRGGLPLLGGYVRNLRDARARDDGAALPLDAGDTYQGGIESNLSEGAIAVDAAERAGAHRGRDRQSRVRLRSRGSWTAGASGPTPTARRAQGHSRSRPLPGAGGQPRGSRDRAARAVAQRLAIRPGRGGRRPRGARRGHDDRRPAEDAGRQHARPPGDAAGRCDRPGK